MSGSEYLNGLLVTVMAIKKVLEGPETERYTQAHEAYRELLDDFYEEFEHIMAPQQYEAAKKDPDYFIVLIQLAYYYQSINAKSDSDTEKPFPDWKLFTRC